MRDLGTIIYLHGFRSSAASVKATAFRLAVDALPMEVRPRLQVPDLPNRPMAAIDAVITLVRQCANPASVTFVGSSLGGYYATWLAEHFGARAALINPAVRPYDDLESYLGVQVNMYTGEQFEVTRANLDELAKLAVVRISRPDRYFLLVETGDEVLDYRQAVAFYGGAWQYVRGGGSHAFTDFVAQIPAVFRFAGVAIACDRANVDSPLPQAR